MSASVSQYSEVYSAVSVDVASSESVAMLTYDVPELSPDGTCSASRGMFEKFSLSEALFGCSVEEAVQQHPKSVERIVKLNALVKSIADKFGINWLGLYLKRKIGDEESLLKIAYTGSPSRAVFPLTELFAKLSNNSFCAMHGSRTIIQNTETYAGPYYVCDVNVKSEYCAALFGNGSKEYNNPEGELEVEKIRSVTGLIDAEAWTVNAFTEEVISHLEALGSFVGILFKEGVVID